MAGIEVVGGTYPSPLPPIQVTPRLWGNLTKEQIDEIRSGAGERTERYFTRRLPFYHKETLVFGGHCGICGKWNWQWCLKGFEWTAPCAECSKILPLVEPEGE